VRERPLFCGQTGSSTSVSLAYKGFEIGIKFIC
jgi:hypothetical protein